VVAVGLLAGSGCVSGDRRPALAGSAPAASWHIEQLTPHIDGYRTQWRYVLRLRDATGRGLHLTRLTRRFLRAEFTHWDQWVTSIDLRVAPGAEAAFPCGHGVFARGGGPARLWDVVEKRIYAGADGGGVPVQFEIDLPFGDTDAVPQPAPLVFFAGFVATRPPATTNPPSEALAAQRVIVALDSTEPIHFLVAVDSDRGTIPIRTRWSSPSGEEIRIEEGEIRERFVSAGYLFAHVTHSRPPGSIVQRPGRWNVELSLYGKHVGTYVFDVGDSGATSR